MATTATARSTDAPPDVRGPTSPLPASVLGLGIVALSLVLGGTLALQIGWAVSGGSLTAECQAAGLTPFVPQSASGPARGIIGAKGVCNIVTAITSPEQTALLVVGVATALVAIVLGFGWYRRMDSKRKRDQCITGAVLSVQASHWPGSSSGTAQGRRKSSLGSS
jgi:hypothetical protein